MKVNKGEKMETTLPRKLEGNLLEMALAMDKEKEIASAQLTAIEEKIDETRVIFWDAVHDEFKDLDRNVNHIADCEYANIGVVVLKEKKHEKGEMPKEFKDILDRILKR